MLTSHLFYIHPRTHPVVLLAEGRLIYQGPRREMTDFFAAFGHPVPLNYNPADHIIEVVGTSLQLFIC